MGEGRRLKKATFHSFTEKNPNQCSLAASSVIFGFCSFCVLIQFWQCFLSWSLKTSRLRNAFFIATSICLLPYRCKKSFFSPKEDIYICLLFAKIHNSHKTPYFQFLALNCGSKNSNHSTKKKKKKLDSWLRLKLPFHFLCLRQK